MWLPPWTWSGMFNRTVLLALHAIGEKDENQIPDSRRRWKMSVLEHPDPSMHSVWGDSPGLHVLWGQGLSPEWFLLMQKSYFLKVIEITDFKRHFPRRVEEEQEQGREYPTEGLDILGYLLASLV